MRDSLFSAAWQELRHWSLALAVAPLIGVRPMTIKKYLDQRAALKQ